MALMFILSPSILNFRILWKYYLEFWVLCVFFFFFICYIGDCSVLTTYFVLLLLCLIFSKWSIDIEKRRFDKLLPLRNWNFQNQIKSDWENNNKTDEINRSSIFFNKLCFVWFNLFLSFFSFLAFISSQMYF